MCVDAAVFARDFDVQHFAVSYENPVTAFSGVIVQKKKTGNTTLITTYFGKGVILDYSVEGQKLADNMNNQINNTVTSALWLYSGLLYISTWGLGSGVGAIAKTIISGLNASANAYVALIHRKRQMQ